MSTLGIYVDTSGHLVKVVNGQEVRCSTNQSAEIAQAIIAGQINNKKVVAVHDLPNTLSRGLVLEQKQGDSYKTISLADLLPCKYDGTRGSFHVTIEFIPELIK
jgi:hypothetical protein